MKLNAIAMAVCACAAAIPAAAGAATYATIHTFNDLKKEMAPNTDGSLPAWGDLANINGTLYGATSYGANPGNSSGSSGFGAIYTITPDGTENVLYDFKGASTGDGQQPLASLLNVGGTLYGVTTDQVNGTNLGPGTVFSLTTAGSKTVLAETGTTPNVGAPTGGLATDGSNFYGPSSGNSETGAGAIYAVSPSGTVSLLYNFQALAPLIIFGPNPLIMVNGVFYGTTQYGGANKDGLFFSLTASGVLTELYSFTGSTRSAMTGRLPYGALIYLNGLFYGTTSSGGTGCKKRDCGTVYSITPAGKVTQIYAFKGGTDGARPVSGLNYTNGVFYGATEEGGGLGTTRSGCKKVGCGTVYAVTPGGAETVLHAFAGGSDGEVPVSGLTTVGNSLFGTTLYGGGGNESCTGGGCGTVYSITP